MAARTLAAVSASTRRSSVDCGSSQAEGPTSVANALPKPSPSQVQRNPAQPGAKPGRTSKAVQADQGLDGGLLEDVVDVLAPVEEPADERRC